MLVSDVAIASVKEKYYRIPVWYECKDETINLLRNVDLIEKDGIKHENLLSHIKSVKKRSVILKLKKQISTTISPNFSSYFDWQCK